MELKDSDEAMAVDADQTPSQTCPLQTPSCDIKNLTMDRTAEQTAQWSKNLVNQQ